MAHVWAPSTSNYVAGRGLLTTHYYYVDREPWIADRLFIDDRLPVHFVNEWENADSGYVVVHVWVWRWQETRIERCLSQLHKVSLLMGRRGYAEACGCLGDVYDNMECAL